MFKLNILHRHLGASLVGCAALAAGAAQAAVLAPIAPNFAGDYTGISYGNGGEVFELQPYLFVNGLGGADAAVTVAGRNGALDFSFSASSRSDSLLVVQYTLQNLSAVESFDQIRFMVFANPDGDPNDYADIVGESWGPALVGDPVRRETMSLPTLANIITNFQLNNNLTDGAAGGTCVSASGCDAIFALQWDAPILGPGEQFVLQVGLSDDGSALSSRWLSATALNSPGTTLTFSGFGQVSAVPETSTWALLSCGLIGLHGLMRRRERKTTA